MKRHTFSPGSHEAEARRISEFRASLVYKKSSESAKATQATLPVLKNQNQPSKQLATIK